MDVACSLSLLDLLDSEHLAQLDEAGYNSLLPERQFAQGVPAGGFAGVPTGGHEAKSSSKGFSEGFRGKLRAESGKMGAFGRRRGLLEALSSDVRRLILEFWLIAPCEVVVAA